MNEPPLSGSDREIVREALEEIRATPLPPDRATMGCVVALPGFAVLLVFPLAARVLGIGGAVATTVVSIGIVLLVVGLVIWFSAGSFMRGHVTAAAEAALRRLEQGDGADRETVLRACTLLLMNAYTGQGAHTSAGFDFAGAERRLGDRLPTVVAVERLLLEEGATPPVFTHPEGRPGSELGR